MNSREESWKISNNIIKEAEKAIVGKENVLKFVVAGVLCDGHILIEDFPGLAKTLMAKTLARILGCSFRRVQFTPDVLPADIIGTYVYDESSGEFKLRKGPLFTNILLADEINRAPPKTQSALLEAMQERQATIEGITHVLPKPFIVMATQNPIEYEGTYPLPEAQIDRFLMRLRIGYPDKKDEIEIMRRRIARKSEDVNVDLIANPTKVLELQKAVEEIHIDSSIQEYIVEIIARTRADKRLVLGASPRGSLAVFKIARAIAILNNRDYVTPDDVKRAVIPGVAHRLILKPEIRVRGVTSENVLEDILRQVPVPAL
ncbi:MAG: MoxR family ATPase [Candidatus Thermoplasmatota archaeon]|nr:MoxR family ATPase [Candidatus Thermoplasmatota archaeon]